jgi:hypothetical protein
MPKPLYERALAILNKYFKPDHPHVRACSNNYARLLEEMEKSTTTPPPSLLARLRRWVEF